MLTFGSSSASPSLWLGSVGIPIDLHASFSVSFKRSMTYFYCKINTFNLGKSFISRGSILTTWILLFQILLPYIAWALFSIFRYYLSQLCNPHILEGSTLLELECLINKVWFSWLCLYLIASMILANLLNNAVGNCLSPWVLLLASIIDLLSLVSNVGKHSFYWIAAIGN